MLNYWYSLLLVTVIIAPVLLADCVTTGYGLKKMASTSLR